MWRKTEEKETKFTGEVWKREREKGKEKQNKLSTGERKHYFFAIPYFVDIGNVLTTLSSIFSTPPFSYLHCTN